MTASADVLSFLLTYLLHSTVLLGGTWLAVRGGLVRAPAVADVLWKLALVGGLATAALQTGLGLHPLSGRLRLDVQAHAAAPAPGRLAAAAPGASAPRAPAPDPARVAAPAREPGAARDAARVRDTDSPTRDAARTRQRVRDTDPAHVAGPVRALGFAAAPGPALALGPRLAGPRALGLAGETGSPAYPALDSPATLAAALWLGCALLGLLRFVALRRRLAAALGAREPVTDAGLLALFDGLLARAGLGRRVRLTVSSRLAGPVALGREICLPRRALTELPPRQQEAMLAHELGHVVRRDPLWLNLCALLEAVLFFQPLNRVGRRQLQEASEFLCDDWAVSRTGRGLVLAQCLAEVAGWVADSRRPALVAGMVRRDSSFLRRVERLARCGAERTGSRPGRALLLGVFLLAIVSCSVPAVSVGDEEAAAPGLLERLLAVVHDAVFGGDETARVQERAQAAAAREAAEERAVLTRLLRRPAGSGEAEWPQVQLKAQRIDAPLAFARAVALSPVVAALADEAAADGEDAGPVVLRIRDGLIVGATYGGHEMSIAADSDGEVRIRAEGLSVEDGVLRLVDESGRTLIVLDVGDVGDAHHVRDVDSDDVDDADEADDVDEADEARGSLHLRRRELDRRLRGLEREYQRTRAGVEQTLQELERDHERAVEDARREAERGWQERERGFRRARQEREHRRDERLRALEAERETFLRDFRGGEDELERWELEWETSHEQLAAEFDDALDEADASFEDELAALEDELEQVLAEQEDGFADAWDGLEDELAALEDDFELASEAWAAEVEALEELSAGRDCDHGCASRCADGCTHPDDEDADEATDEATDEWSGESIEWDWDDWGDAWDDESSDDEGDEPEEAESADADPVVRAETVR